MKTKEQILDAVKNGKTWERSNCEFLDSRDFSRLADYFPVDVWGVFGFAVKEGARPKQKRLTEKAVLKRMAVDLDFAFEKAIGERGISSSLMFDVMKMWMWVLEDELADYGNYAPYGMPLYCQIAQKYNLPDKNKEYGGRDVVM